MKKGAVKTPFFINRSKLFIKSADCFQSNYLTSSKSTSSTLLSFGLLFGSLAALV